MSAKPLLLLDVDGPLNPYDANPTRRPDGYETHRLTPTGWRRPLRVWLNPSHGPMLLALAELMDLTWATAWQRDANSIIAPLIGLPELPVIEFPKRESYPFGQIFKRDDVEKYAGERPFAWLDDDFEPADFEWAEARAESGIPTLLLHIDPKVGIVQQDLDRVAEWATP